MYRPRMFNDEVGHRQPVKLCSADLVGAGSVDPHSLGGECVCGHAAFQSGEVVARLANLAVFGRNPLTR